jgi:hypothetical protein
MMPRIRSMPTNKLHVRCVESDEKMKLENFCILSLFSLSLYMYGNIVAGL